MHYLIAGIIGLFSGVASGLLGVGGGIIMVPAMMFFMKMEPKMAIGTSLAIIIPTAISGTVRQFVLGHVDWRAVAAIAPMAVVGAVIGASLTQHVPGLVLKRIFGAFLLFVGLRLLVK